MKKLSASQTLNYLIEVLIYYLETSGEISNSLEGCFALGEKTAYVECLEVVQRWKNAHKSGLDFNIEERFPI